MALSDLFLLFLRWLHLLAAAAWVGGNIFFFAVLNPAVQGVPQGGAVSRLAGQEFRNMVDVAISVLLVTGAILSFNRLTAGHASVAYAVVLAFKIGLSFWMFYLVWVRSRHRPAAASQSLQSAPTGIWFRMARNFNANNLLLALGLVVLLLADLLRALFENTLGT